MRIGRNVWIGRGSCVLPGVTIGDNAVIGANSVVTRNIPSDALAVGAPARVTGAASGGKPVRITHQHPSPDVGTDDGSQPGGGVS